MKMLIVGLAVATLLGGPAFAQSYDPDIGTGNITPPMNIAPPIDDPASAWGFDQRGHEPSARVVPRGRAQSRSPYTAHGAVTPFGSPSSTRNRNNQSTDARAAAVRECSEMSRKYSQPTWGNYEMHQFRTCMMQHGLPE
jgi:hypothetical protein